MMNFVDRTALGLLLQPIKVDLQLSDTELGFVTGIAFAIFYAVLGLPIARWSDRGNRVSITAFFIALWGLTVMASSLIGNFIQLLMARIAAAVGEAGCMPPTYSLVGDYFPKANERARAMAVYMAASPLAAIVGFVGGGWLNDQFGWRTTFLVLGIPGLILAAIVILTLKDDRPVQPASEADKLVPFGQILSIMWRGKACRHLTIGLILLYTVGLGLSPWTAAFLIRTHGMSTTELGLWFGLIFGGGGALGAALAIYSTHLKAGSGERRQMRLSAIGVAMLSPSYCLFLFAPDKYWAMAAQLPLTIGFSFLLGPSFALMQRLVPDRSRASVMAVFMLLANLIGMGLGPQLVGILSDMFADRVSTADALRYAMLSLTWLPLWAAFHLLRAGTLATADLAAIEAAVDVAGGEEKRIPGPVSVTTAAARS